jgi:hypothetical protein
MSMNNHQADELRKLIALSQGLEQRLRALQQTVATIRVDFEDDVTTRVRTADPAHSAAAEQLRPAFARKAAASASAPPDRVKL